MYRHKAVPGRMAVISACVGLRLFDFDAASGQNAWFALSHARHWMSPVPEEYEPARHGTQCERLEAPSATP